MKDLNKVRHECFKMLARNMVKPTTKLGKSMIYAYWMGVLHDATEIPPYIAICLSCGRHDELILEKLE
jgi:hypothetical protein